MKKITLSIFLLVFSIGFSQNAPITFESGGFGSTWTWTTFENPSTPAPPLQIIANPDASGGNTSATVAKLTPLVGSPPYAGVETALNAGIGTFTLSASNCTVKIMVWKTVISDVGIKFAASGASTGEIKVANTLVNQWEELTFNFAGKIGEASSTGINQIVVFPDFQARTTDNVCYFDNITFSAQLATPTGPTVAATTPTRPAANVISMFSNAYTNVTVDTWKTDWSPVVTLEDIQVAGNDTKKYSNLQFVGIETIGANLIDASGMLYFHIDYWTPNMTAFRVKLVDVGANAEFGGGDDTESELTFTPTIAGWNSLEIPLSDFMMAKSHIAQLIFSGNPSGPAVVYIDNVYFHNVAFSDPNTPVTAAPTPTRPQANVISMFSNAYSNVPVNTWRTDWSQGNLLDLMIAGNDTKKYSALNFVGIETLGANAINASQMLYFHVDAWTPNMTAFRIKLVDFGANNTFQGGDDKEFELSFTPTLSGWNSYDIPLSAFTGLTTTSNISQLIFSGNPSGTGIVFIDNVYFSNVPLGVDNFETSKIKVYPNPVANQLTIEGTSNIQEVGVYNVLGQNVVSSKPNASISVLDISNLQIGVYIVKATIDGKTITSKVIKK